MRTLVIFPPPVDVAAAIFRVTGGDVASLEIATVPVPAVVTRLDTTDLGPEGVSTIFATLDVPPAIAALIADVSAAGVFSDAITVLTP
jgi:hypothetical protein